MPDKKLTDSEIVKALECCVNEKTCKNCAYSGRSCMTPLKRDTLNLINRLQADIENYKQVAEHQQSVTMDRGFEIKRLKEKIESLQAENERLNAGADSLFNTLDYRLERILKLEDNLKTAKTAAYKEFAERLKEESYERIDLTAYVEVSDINNLLQEMVGDNNV